jgi:hypothetical protein
MVVLADGIHYIDVKFDQEIGKGNFGEVWRGIYFHTPIAAKKISLDDAHEVLISM